LLIQEILTYRRASSRLAGQCVIWKELNDLVFYPGDSHFRYNDVHLIGLFSQSFSWE